MLANYDITWRYQQKNVLEDSITYSCGRSCCQYSLHLRTFKSPRGCFLGGYWRDCLLSLVGGDFSAGLPETVSRNVLV